MLDLERNILDQYGKLIVERLQQAIKEKPVTKYGAVNASGDLAKSVRYEVDDRGLRVFAADYIYYVNTGRRPGKFPPIDSIKQWIEDKRLSFDIPIDSLAFLIARKISKKGTTAWEQGGTDLVESVVTPELLKEIADKVILEVVREIKSDILKSYQKAA